MNVDLLNSVVEFFPEPFDAEANTDLLRNAYNLGLEELIK